ISAVNSPPVVNAPANIGGINEDEEATIGGSLSIVDVDAGSNDVTITLSLNQGGRLSVTGGGGGVPSGDISGNNSSAITMTGTVAEINNTLATLKYRGATNFNGTEKLAITVNDNGH